MADITSVEQGDRFENADLSLEVVKIWFEYSEADQRWETSVTWGVDHPLMGYDQRSAKARDFVRILQDERFVRMNKAEKIPLNVATTASVSPPGPNGPYVSPTADPKLQKLEDDFRRNATKYGLSPSDLGRKVTLAKHQPGSFTIIGAKPRNWKLPILIRSKRGRIYKITAEKAKAAMV